MDAEEDAVATFDRRNLLKTTGAGIAAVPVFGTAAGQSEEDDDVEASVTFEDQTTDGTSVVVAHAETDVEAFVVIEDEDGEMIVWDPSNRLNLEAGEVVEDATLELDEWISEPQELTAILWETNGPVLDEDTALVEIDEDSPEQIEGFGPILIDEDPDAGFNYPYYLYAPDRLENEEPRPPLVEPNNTGTATDDFEQHREAAESTVENGAGRTIADELGAPFVVPAFPRPRSEPVDGYHYVHALDDTTMRIDDGPLERVDLQLLAMVEDARKRLEEAGYPLPDDSGDGDDGIMLNGFSASGNFVERFATLHPDEVISVTAGGLNGMPVLPIEETVEHTLEYHVGIANVEELTGDQFDLEAFRDVNRFLYMGEVDDSDTIPYGDAWTDDDLRETALDVYGTHMIDDRFAYSKAVYDEIDADAVFRMYEGEGHTPRPALDDLVEFHERSLAGDDVEDIRADLGGKVPDLGAHVEYAPHEPAVDETVTFDAGRSSVEDAAIVDFEWDFGDGESATGEVVTHAFETRGGHNVTLTATDDAGETHRTVVQVAVGVSDLDEREVTETEIDFEATPGAESDEVTVEYSIEDDAIDDDSDDDWLEIRAFEAAGSEITDSPGFVTPGESASRVLQLNRPLEAGETVFVAILPPGGYHLETAKEEALAITDAEVAQIERIEGLEPTFVEADSGAGFNYPYYLYAPDARGEEEPKPFLVEPNNTGTSTDDFEQHRARAESTVESGIGRTIADVLGAPLLVPVFPRPREEPVDWTHYVQALDDTTMGIDDGPLERVDLQLLAMVEDARKRLEEEGYPLPDDDGIMLNGFSASGNFVERFATLHPDEVISVTAGGLNGMPVLPIEEADGDDVDGRTLNYHVGVADVEELTGDPFDLEAFRDVNRFLYLGEIDMNDTIPYGDAWTDDDLRETALDVYGRNMQADRFPYSKAVYDEVDADAVFRIYEGAHHTPRPAADDLVEFHERSLAGDDIEDIRADLGRNVPNRRAAVEYTPRVTEVGTQVAFHAVETEFRSGEPVDFEWDFGDGETATGDVVTHTFETAGTHAVTLTVTDETGDTHQAVEYVTVPDEPMDEDDLEAVFEYTPEEPEVGDEVTLDASDSSPAERIDAYEWTIDADGTIELNGETVTYTFDDPGEYEVTLAITDADSNSDTTTDTLTVETDDLDEEPALEDYADDDGIVHPPGVLEAIDDWRDDQIDTPLVLDVIDAWRSGEPVM